MILHAALLLAAAGPAAIQCTPEHAAMGHCRMPAAKPKPQAKPKPAARPKPTTRAVPRPKPTPMPAPAPKPAPAQPPATPPAAAPIDPECPPEHAAIGHCKPALPAPGASVQAAGPPGAPPPPTASGGPEHAADAIWDPAEMARARRAVYAEHGGFTGSKVVIDRLEYRATDGGDGYAFEGEAWFGGDYDRLWIKAGGEGEFGESLESAELQALFSRALDPWFNLQAGVRQDMRPGPDRTYLALGVQGVAPYWFEIDAAAFLSTRGELTARVEGEYDQRLTNRLILQPRIELGLAAQDMPDMRVGAGLTQIEAGLRLRYEVVPEFAPYAGVAWERALGRSADFAKATGEGTGGWSLVAGVRAWF